MQDTTSHVYITTLASTFNGTWSTGNCSYLGQSRVGTTFGIHTHWQSWSLVRVFIFVYLVKTPGPLEYVKDLQVPDHTICVGDNTYRRNWRDIKSSPSQAPPLEVDLDGITAAGKSTSSPDIEQQLPDPKLPTPEPEVPCDLPIVNSPAEGVSLGVRHSQHERKVNFMIKLQVEINIGNIYSPCFPVYIFCWS